MDNKSDTTSENQILEYDIGIEIEQIIINKNREIYELLKKNEEYERKIEEFKTSNSWRIGRVFTKPVRIIKSLIKKLKNKDD